MNDNKLKKTNVAIKRYHKDDVSKITGLVLGVIAGGLAVAIGKVVQWARKARADKEREREYIEYIRTGKITESKYVSEIIYVIKRAIDRYYLSGDLDPIFNRNGIVPSRRDAYIKRIKEDISKCKTLEQLNNYIETKTPFHSSHFDDLEYVTELFRRARTMRDSKSFKVITHDSMPKDSTNIAKRTYNKKYIDGFSLGEKLKGAWNKLQPEDKAATISLLGGAVISGVVILANYLIDRRTIKDIQLGVITEKDLVRKVADKILLGLENSYMNYETAMTIVPIIKGIKNAKTFDELRKYFSSSELDKAERLYRRAMATKKKDSSRITTHDSMPWVKKSRNDSLKRYNDIDLKSVVDKIKQQIAKVKQGLVDWGKDHPKAAFRIKRILKILAAIGVDIAASKFASNGGKTNADYNKIKGMKRELENGIIDLEKMDDGSYGVPEMPNELKMWLRILVGLIGKFVAIGLAVSAIRQKKTDSIRRHTDFDLKSKVSQLKAYFVKVKKDLEEWGERNPATKLAIKNMARAVSVAISIAAGRSFTKDLKTLEHLRDNVKNDYIELIQQRDGSFGLPAVPSKIKMGLKLFVSALSGIITILISKSYTREERTANVINSFFNY